MDDHPLRIIIAEDEAPARDELLHLFSRMEGIEIIGTASDGLSALELIRNNQPDLAVLDIQMPGMDGITLAGKILTEEVSTSCIFTTAYDAFAVNAFEVHAVDYLLKPLRAERLAEAVEKVRKRRQRDGQKPQNKENVRALLEEYLGNRKWEDAPRYISVFSDSRIIPIRLPEILFAEARGRNAWIVTGKGEFKTRGTFNEMEALLGNPPFFHCHRSYIVNTDEVESIDLWVNNTYRLKIRNTELPVPVSRGHMDAFKKLMGL